jgi:hypothetical protein
MPSIKDIPPELLLSIFEYLDIAELFILNIVFGETLDAYFDCFRLPQLENGFVFHRPDTVRVLVRHPLFMRCFSLLFGTDESKMTLQLDCKEACIHVKCDFHPYNNGTESVERVTFLANFLCKKKLPDGSVESIFLSYRTAGYATQAQVDEMHEGNQVTRTLLHRMSLRGFQWRTSFMPTTSG